MTISPLVKNSHSVTVLDLKSGKRNPVIGDFDFPEGLPTADELPCSDAKFQLYKLIEGEYVLQSAGQKPYWMPEIGLAIGAEKRAYGAMEREWLYWYDENEARYPTPTERAEAVSQQFQNEAAARIAVGQENNVLREKLRELGIDPDSIS